MIVLCIPSVLQEVDSSLMKRRLFLVNRLFLAQSREHRATQLCRLLV